LIYITNTLARLVF